MQRAVGLLLGFVGGFLFGLLFYGVGLVWFGLVVCWFFCLVWFGFWGFFSVTCKSVAAFNLCLKFATVYCQH